MELNRSNLQSIFQKFDHSSKFNSFSELTSGHINDTFFIETKSGDNYVLQRINSYVFKEAKQLIINKVKVSEYIQNKLKHLSLAEQNKRVLKFIKTKDNLPYYKDEEGNFWNVSLFIEGSKTFEKVENIEIAYEGGKLYGDFLNLTNGIDTKEIIDIIPNFHEMSFRYEQFYDALNNASSER